MIGVILAGGKSTRLPHKLLFPQRGIKFKPIISSAIDYASLFCEKVYIVVNNEEETIIHKFLKSLNLLSSKTTLLADNYSGIPKALSIVAKRYPREILFVLCGDNIYEDLFIMRAEEQVAVRNYHCKQIEQLSVYHNKQYISHLEQEHKYLLSQQSKRYLTALTTPWILNAKRFLSTDFVNTNSHNFIIENWLTKWHISAEIYPSDSWWDIGTFEAYQAYVENRKF